MRVLAPCAVAIVFVLFSTVTPAHAARGGIVIINTGEDTIHVRDLPAEVAEATGFPTIAYRYDLFGLFWLDLWRWGGEFVAYDESRATYAPLTAEDLEALGGARVPWKYRCPPGLFIVLGLIYLGVIISRRMRIASTLVLAAIWAGAAVLLYQNGVDRAFLVPAALALFHAGSLALAKKVSEDDVPELAPAASAAGPYAAPAAGPYGAPAAGPYAAPAAGPYAANNHAAPPDLAAPRMRSGSLPVFPEHLRGRLRYAVVSAEITAGGIDARHEDGVARLVLWRDVVGVVVRRAPPDYGDLVFVDIVSTAGATLRVLPWTRVTGDLAAIDPDARPRALVEYVLAHCPAVQLDPGTQHLLDRGIAVQLPDLGTLQQHDQHLA